MQSVEQTPGTNVWFSFLEIFGGISRHLRGLWMVCDFEAFNGFLMSQAEKFWTDNVRPEGVISVNYTFVVAYLDPGTGSMLLQAIVGGSAGLLVLCRHLWRSFRYARTTTGTDITGT